MTVLEVFADVACPFTHVGLRRLVERREAAGREDVRLWVRSWPLEVVNGSPLDAHFIAEEVEDIRRQATPDLFAGFAESAFPATSMPAMALAVAGYRRDAATGEAVSLALRDLLFEQGRDVSSSEVLDELADRHGLQVTDADSAQVRADHDEGVDRGVIGSPHFFTAAGGFFCPSLDVSRDDDGSLRVQMDQGGFDRFVATVFS